LLIDKVKGYTNLFVLASGELPDNTTAMTEIGDYAINSGLNYAVYFGIDEASEPQSVQWLDIAHKRWGNQFVGVYYNDEPGGKFLEGYLDISRSGTSIVKLGTGGIVVQLNNTNTIYYANNTIKSTTDLDDKSKNGTLQISQLNGLVEEIPNVPWPEEWVTTYPNGTVAAFIPPSPISTVVTYYPNGAITVWESQSNIVYTSQNGSERISQVEPLSAVIERNPINNYNAAAQAFVNNTTKYLQLLDNQTTNIFTADFALYWWEYQSGYDTVLAELGWNNTATQEIGLVRGAANLHGKNWGTIITWKYNQPPYLGSGEEMYDQLRLSYECGANYALVFNYAEDVNGPYGTLQDEHFQAIERFWNTVVQNISIRHGGIKAEAVLVLPRNYGWGMRNPQDTIWGMWDANATSQQIWTQIHSRLTQHGSQLDIVFEDKTYSVSEKYNHIYYWNQTS
ncbi:MAG: hypothetical protein WDA42_07535, partial [Candidatus Bathyarchaeia archaeon]